MEQKNYGNIIAWGIVGVFLVVGFLLLYHQPSGQTVQTSTYNVGPTQPGKQNAPQVNQEPDVTDWKAYNSDQYNFTLQVPSDWNQAEYTSPPPRGGHIIAFSPNQLPCSTCSYLHDGYFSIRIYDQKTYPDEYALFQQAVKAAGQSSQVQPINIAGKTGILYNNTYSVENQGIVYEFNLDKDNGADSVTSSKIFQKAAASFAFTNLIFNY